MHSPGVEGVRRAYTYKFVQKGFGVFFAKVPCTWYRVSGFRHSVDGASPDAKRVSELQSLLKKIAESGAFWVYHRVLRALVAWGMRMV